MRTFISIGVLQAVSSATWCSDFKSSTLATYDCNPSWTECIESARISDDDDTQLLVSMTPDERKLVKGGIKYEEACGDTAAMRLTQCNAFKEKNPGDTSSIGYKNYCYYESEADQATHILAAMGSTAFFIATIGSVAF